MRNKERLESKIKTKPKPRIDEDEIKVKGVREDETKVWKEKGDLEDLSNYISLNLEGLSLWRIDEPQEIIVKQDLILFGIK